MEQTLLSRDPYNLIITGVGGQGNVLASRLLGNMLSLKGLYVTIGETFGASQRGGAVMSHLRISSGSVLSPLIPKGRGHMVVALEPTEALRVLKDFGNPEAMALSNTRPIYSVGVISGDQAYPKAEDIKTWMGEMTARYWLINATEEAVKMGNPIYGNIMMIGGLAGTGELPLDRGDFEVVLSRTMSADKLEANLKAFDRGVELVSQSH